MREPVRPAERHGSPRVRAGLALRHRLFPGAVAGGALLLFCWPFVRSPPLPLGHAWAHLMVAWALLIATLFAVARALDGPRSDEEDAD